MLAEVRRRENLEKGRVNEMKNRLIVCSMLGLFTYGLAFGQQPTPKSGESHKYRTIFTIAGGGGGFAVGLVAGLAAFDDAINSDRKVWTTAALSAVGGYFLGRALDKRTKKTNVTWMPDELDRSLIHTQWSALQANESTDPWQGAGLADFAGSFLPRDRVGIGQAEQHLPPYQDVSHLYLVSVLRRMESTRDRFTLEGVHGAGGEGSSRR